MSNSVPLRGETDKKLGAGFAPLQVQAQDTPNMTVRIRAGSFWTADNVVVEYAGGNSPAIAAPSLNPRWTLVSLTATGSVAITHGTESNAPSIPAPPVNNLPLAAIYMTTSTTAITADRVMDVRPYVRVVDSVPNIEDELNDRPTFADLNNALDLKADLDGTTSDTFTLNKDAVVGTNVVLYVERGAATNVGIRWNETLDQWEFTNDGSTWVEIASVSGTFMPIVSPATTGNLPTLTMVGELVDSGVALTDLATDAELAAGLDTKLDDFVGVDGNVVVVSGSGTSLADGAIALSALATDVELTAGLATKVDLAGDTMTGDLTVQTGVNQPITLSSRDTGSSGLLVDRGVDPDAVLEWDESTNQWIAGTIGSAFPILTSENLALSDLTDVGALTPSAGDVLRYVGGTWTDDPLTDKADTTALTTHTGDATIHFTQASIDHDALLNFVADEHVAHSSVILTAGTGLTGGGDITTSRTFDVAALKGSQAFTFGAILANDVGDSTNTLTLTGAVVGDPVILGLPAAVPTGFTYVGYVSAPDTITIRAHGSASSGTGAGAADVTINVMVMQYAAF